MGKRIKLGVAKLGERGQSSGAIITGANLRRPPAKPLPPDDPIFKEGLVIYTPYPARPKPKEEPEVEKEPPKA